MTVRAQSPEIALIRESIRGLCEAFPPQYWRHLDREGTYPTEFVRALTEAGWLSALIPEEFGGGGLGVTQAAAILQEINRSGANSAAAHAQMYVLTLLVRHASDELKRKYLPAIAAGALRLQAFAVTEPTAGSETTQIATSARRVGSNFVISGSKVFISRVLHSDLMLLLARTSPPGQSPKDGGLGVFLVEVDAAIQSGALQVQPIETMINHSTTELFIDGLVVSESTLVGEEGNGFRYLVDGWNAERILIAAECVGDADWFIERSASYASSRRVFGRPVGANQGVQFPIARAYADARAAELMTQRAAWLFDDGSPCGPEANMAKLLASTASWAAANACMDAHGGYSFAVEYDIERKFRETRLYSIAPVSNNLILAYLGHKVIGLPKSY
jgi:alkylation response protein AidB-like acyl-CoA dehydrogenase